MLSRVEIYEKLKTYLEEMFEVPPENIVEARLYEDLTSTASTLSTSSSDCRSTSRKFSPEEFKTVRPSATSLTACRRFLRLDYLHWRRSAGCRGPALSRNRLPQPGRGAAACLRTRRSRRPAVATLAHLGSGGACPCCRRRHHRRFGCARHAACRQGYPAAVSLAAAPCLQRRCYPPSLIGALLRRLRESDLPPA